MFRPTFIVFLILLSSCVSKSSKDALVCIQVLDKNDLSETITSKEKLKKFESTNFLESQPYKQITRIYENGESNKKGAKVTSYHQNGKLHQYLEIINARACGKYLEFHPNGSLYIEAFVLDGPPTLSSSSQKDWLFNGRCKIWDENGNLIVVFSYQNGNLVGPSLYFYPNKKLKKREFYKNNELEGRVSLFSEDGQLQNFQNFKNGKLNGLSKGTFPNKNKFEEIYENDLLIEAKYCTESGEILSHINNGFGKKTTFPKEGQSKIIEFQKGLPEGRVDVFKNDKIHKRFFIRKEQKHGEEIKFYLQNEKPKISINWVEDEIQGTAKIWYENGQICSQTEMMKNQKNGLSTSWYEEGSLMLIENYENDKLLNGKYYKKGESFPVSYVINGNGTSTIFDKKGVLLKKIKYEKGVPTEN